MFTSTYEEDLLFPHLNMSREDARLIRYLVSNMHEFRNGELVQMNLESINGLITANGLVFLSGENRSFESEIQIDENGATFYSEIEEIGKKGYYSIDNFKYLEREIEVISKVEGKGEFIDHIPYKDEELELK